MLRSLREVAQVYRFQAPSVARLAERLKQVCAAEGMSADLRALENLAVRTECDVRACLNALQLLHRSGVGATLDSISDASVGAKDFTLGVMDAWRAVFSKARRVDVRGGAGGRPSALSQAEAEAAETRRVLASLYAVGEHDLVLTGLHGNLANLSYTDVLCHKTTRALRWLSDADQLLGCAMATGTFSLLAYAPCFALGVRAAVATDTERPQVQWPAAEQRLAREAQSRRAMLLGWQRLASPAVHSTVSSTEAALEAVPLLLTILAPALRTASVMAMPPAEREVLRNLVDVMVSYGFSYTMHSGTDERGVFVSDLALDPPLGKLTALEGAEEQVARRVVVSAMRQARRCLPPTGPGRRAIRSVDPGRQSYAACVLGSDNGALCVPAVSAGARPRGVDRAHPPDGGGAPRPRARRRRRPGGTAAVLHGGAGAAAAGDAPSQPRRSWHLDPPEATQGHSFRGRSDNCTPSPFRRCARRLPAPRRR